ncbi:hypothetical protein GCM10007387_15620 [Pseudoduganella albidiflava]|uniref:Sel1 repeat family protein n=1 Tax=Pseudoduganella albidiflava TaxID=321983 RepID=A0A411WY07_9BURK|nr:sel1 repeat family protein [Pseudoduganella albidiflava]GGY34553.1 hypothetical protein GCM10007387_15620 [Pseudoduganella albidiflava]
MNSIKWKFISFPLAFGLLTVLLILAYDSYRRGYVGEIPRGISEFNILDTPPACAAWKQNMPKLRDPIAHEIYIKARKLWRSKAEWALTREEATQILNGVRDAAERGDWGARALLARFYLQGLGVLESNQVLAPIPEKAIEIVRTGAELQQPWALYDLGVAYQHGYGGVPQDGRIAWAYYAKAAERGSPEAQLALAEAYGASRQIEKQETMRMCAFTQRFGPAASLLGGNRRAVVGDFNAAILFFQNGVEFGDRDSALTLGRLFSEEFWPHMGIKTKPELEVLGIQVDRERSDRYHEIAQALEINPI